MTKGRRTKQEPPHRILREIYRHYHEFEAYVAATGNHVIEYTYSVFDDTGENIVDRVPVTLSFFDLKEGIEGSKLSKRKRQAIMLNVVRDMKQKDVADIMGITTVSVGQYVEQACVQLAQDYFPELIAIYNEYLEEIEDTAGNKGE